MECSLDHLKSGLASRISGYGDSLRANDLPLIFIVPTYCQGPQAGWSLPTMKLGRAAR